MKYAVGHAGLLDRLIDLGKGQGAIPAPTRYLCAAAAAAAGTTYSGYFVAGAPCTIV